VTDLLLTLVTLIGLTLLVCLLVMLQLVLPFVLTGDAADRSGFSSARWQAVAVEGQIAALALVAAVLKAGWPRWLLLLAIVLPWAGLIAVSVMGPRDQRLGGAPGGHQR
jgi:hypothetical protein